MVYSFFGSLFDISIVLSTRKIKISLLFSLFTDLEEEEGTFLKSKFLDYATKKTMMKQEEGALR